MRLRPELLLIAALACAPATRPPAPIAPPVTLDDSEVRLIADLLAMQDERALDTARLTVALTHPRAQVRVQAALAAGRIGDLAAAPALRAALRDTAAEVVATAAFALGELNDSSTATETRLAELAGPGGWWMPIAAAEAAHALGKIDGELGPAALWPALTGDAPASVVHEALLAVWRLPRTPNAVEAVLAHLGAADSETRWRAAYALMRMASPASITALRSALSDTEHRVRAYAARGLAAAAADSADQRSATRLALRAALADPHPHVVVNAVRALAGYRDDADASALVALLSAADAHVAAAAALGLGEVSSTSAAAALDSLVAAPSAPLSLRASALAAYARTAPASAARVADEWADATDWLQRFYAARALAAAPWTNAQPVLTRLARDADARVAAEALGAIAASTDTLPLGHAFYVEGLGAADVMVRAAAARGMGRHPRPMDLPLLLQAYARATRDTLNDAALAAVEALGSLQDAGVPVDRSFFVRFERAPDMIVRRAVASRLGDGWGDVGPATTRLAPADYEYVARSLLAPALAGQAVPRVRIVTERGAIILELDPVAAPLTVASFLNLIREGYYSSGHLRWHRVVPNFVLQDGDLRGDGNGGPAYAIRDEINRLRYGRGALGMALAGPDTGGNQFFITHSPQPHLDGGYTVFGRVSEGMAIADAIVQDDPILAIEVVQ